MSDLPYQKVEIQAFRGLQDLVLKDCGRVNLLVGENNCGKTSVLEALLLLSAPTQVRQWEATVGLRKDWPFSEVRFQEAASNRLDGFRWIFPRAGGGPAEPLSLRVEGSTPLRSLNARMEELRGSPPEKSIESPDQYVEAVLFVGPHSRAAATHSLHPGLTLDLQLDWDSHETTSQDQNRPPRFQLVLWERGGVISFPQMGPEAPVGSSFATPISHRSDGYLASQFQSNIRNRRKDHTLALVRGLDPTIQDLVMLSPEPLGGAGNGTPVEARSAILHADKSDLGLVPVHALGDGTRRAIHFACLLAGMKEGGVLLLDEIEVGMHTSVLQKVFAWLVESCRDNGVQLFATTHSLEAVDSLLSVVPGDDLALYRLRNNKVKRFSGARLRTTRLELGQEIR
jgi:energy-coupling factor transporter ATP-binding protein EcfA2